MFPPDSLVFDIIFPANARPTPQQLFAGMGGEEIAKTRAIVDVDLDVPQIEQEISPSFLLRRRGERRVFIVDEATAPLRANPRAEPIVARDLRPEAERLVAVVHHTGARFGRMNAFGTWGDATIVTRNVRDLRGLMLLGWALDPQTDVDGRRRAGQLSQKEFELKLSVFDKRLDELDDETVLGRIPPARLTRLGEPGNELFVVDCISDRDGSWDIRKSYELERRVAATDLFSRIPGAKQAPAVEPPAPEPVAKEPAPIVEEPPAGPPITAVELHGRVVLRIPAERFSLDAATALGRKNLDILRAGDQVSGKQRDLVHHDGCGFLAPLAFLSEVFLDGKPLDRKRFEADAVAAGEGVRTMEAHLPRFGAVRVIDVGGKRWVTSEVTAPIEDFIELIGRPG